MKRELLDRYRGRWIAVDERGDDADDADDLGEPLRSLEHDVPRPDVVVQRVPEADAPLFVGLS